MPSYGPNFASTYSTTGGSGSWPNTSRMSSDSDSNLASSYGFAGFETPTLNATNFGFAIPSDETVVGVQFEVRRNANVDSAVEDTSVLVLAGSGTSDNKEANFWATSYEVITYGGGADLWGKTFAYSDINGTSFGISITVSNSNPFVTANIDYIRCTVTTEASGGGGGDCEGSPYTKDAELDWSVTTGSAALSDNLDVDGFSFLFGDDDLEVVTGIQIEFEGKTVNSGTVTDRSIQLKMPSVGLIGTSKPGGSFGSTSVYGGENDLWGLEPGEFPTGDFRQTGFGFRYVAQSAGAANYEIASVTMTIWTGGGEDSCGHKRELCLARGTGTAAGKQLQVSITDDADDGTFTNAYFSDGVVLFGFLGSVT